MHMVSIPKHLNSVCTYRIIIRVIVCRWLIDWIQNWFIFINFHSFSRSTPPPSNFTKVVMPLFYSRYDLAQRMYKSDGRITSASEYVHDLYANLLDFFLLNTTSCEQTIFYLLVTYRRDPFRCCGIPTNIHPRPFCAWWLMFNAFLSTCAVGF